MFKLIACRIQEAKTATQKYIAAHRPQYLLRGHTPT